MSSKNKGRNGNRGAFQAKSVERRAKAIGRFHERGREGRVVRRRETVTRAAAERDGGGGAKVRDRAKRERERGERERE